LFDLNCEASSLERSRQTKKARITPHRSEQLWPFPVALIGPAPLCVQHAPLIVPGLAARTPVHKTQACPLYMGKIPTVKNHSHIAIVSLSPQSEKQGKLAIAWSHLR
jgi:hypothetical protein